MVEVYLYYIYLEQRKLQLIYRKDDTQIDVAEKERERGDKTACHFEVTIMKETTEDDLQNDDDENESDDDDDWHNPRETQRERLIS